MLSADADLHTLGLSWRPFVIIDRDLALQAVSRVAEETLNVDETDLVGSRFDELLTEDEHRDDDSFELHAASDPESRFTGRVHTCGTPRAALLVLEPVPSA
jgi:hypothetical protein